MSRGTPTTSHVCVCAREDGHVCVKSFLFLRDICHIYVTKESFHTMRKSHCCRLLYMHESWNKKNQSRQPMDIIRCRLLYESWNTTNNESRVCVRVSPWVCVCVRA